MAEYNLAILLTAKDQASRVLRSVNGELSKTGRVAGGASRAFNNAAKGIAVGAGLFAGAVAVGIRNGLETLAERESLLSETANALEQSGLAARVAATDVAKFSNALEGAIGAAVDDKEIQAAANTILRFGNVNADTWERATTAAVDLGASMGTDATSAAKVLAKALADPTKGMTALRRAGVVLNKTEEDRIKDLVKSNRLQDAQNELLAALERKIKGAAAASQGPYQRAMSVWNDTMEDAQAALAEGFLPLLTKVADKLKTALGDEKTMTNIRNFGKGLADAFDEGLKIAEDIPWGTIGDGLKTAGEWAGKLFDMFKSLPTEVQTTIIALAGLNKLSGGAITGIVSELGKGLIKGVLGLTAGIVNIKAGVVNGGGTPATPGGGGGITGLLRLGSAGLVGIAAAEVLKAIQDGVADWVSGGDDSLESALTKTFNDARTMFLGPFEALADLPENLDRLINGPKTRENSGPLSRNPTPINYGQFDPRTGSPNVDIDPLVAEQQATRRVTDAGLRSVKASINALKLSPRITVPVYLKNQVSARNIYTTQKTIARFGQMGRL